MKYNEEFLHKFLKANAQTKYKEKIKQEQARKKEIEKVKKEIKEKEKIILNQLKKSSEENSQLTNNSNKNQQEIKISSEEKNKLKEISELVVHSEKGIEKTSDEFKKTFNPFPEKPNIFIKPRQIEGNLNPIFLQKNTTSEKILEIPLPPKNLFKNENEEQKNSIGQNYNLEKNNEKTNPLFMPDFGKINRIINDKEVSIIQCDGENIPLKINKNGKIETLNITLDEREINVIIRRFSDRLNQEITKPVFRALLNNLELVAISSSFSGSRFVITKKTD